MRTLKPEHIENVEKHIPLGRENARSLWTLAARMRCSRAAVKRRVAAFVKARGLKLKKTKLREGERGAESVGYYL